MARFSRIQVAFAMEQTGLVPLFYDADIEVCKKVVKACYDGGARLLEFTARGDFAHEVFAELNKYCIAELPIKNSDDFAQWLLEEFDVNGETVMVAPAAGFYSSPGVGLNQIRIAYVLKKESLLKAVNIIREALKVYQD